MDRLMFPSARRIRTTLYSYGAQRSAASASALATSTDLPSPSVVHSRSRRSRSARTNEDLTTRLWSVLEESDLPSSKTKRASENVTDQNLNTSLETASNLTEVDKQWRELRSKQETLFQGEEVAQSVVRRSLAISRVASSISEGQRAAGAFHRVLALKNPPPTTERIRVALNNASESLVRLGSPLRALELIQLTRKSEGTKVLDRKSYAIALAASLDIPAESDPVEHVKTMNEVREGALRSALRYFRDLFLTSNQSQGEKPSLETSSSRWSTFSVLEMLKEDFEHNEEANLSQELFDDVLVLCPAKSPQIAEAMQSVGFTPSKTSFLAMIYGAMKSADASRALSLISEMHVTNVPREDMHYIAAASAMMRRSQRSREELKGHHPIKPWYFSALLEEYIRDFPGRPINSQFASLIVLGMSSIRVGDQELNPALNKLALRLKETRTRVSTEAFGVLLTKLSVTNGEANGSMLLNWMKQVQIKRDRSVNNGLLKVQRESVVRSARGWRASLNEEKKMKSLLQVSLAEELVREMVMLNRTKLNNTLALLQRRLANRPQKSDGQQQDELVSELPLDETATNAVNSRTFELLADMYSQSQQPSVLSQLIKALEKDSTQIIDFSSLYLLLMEGFGLNRQVDEAVEVLAEMQSRGMDMTPQVVHVVTCKVFLYNNRMEEAVANVLGLCRTYHIKPFPETCVQMLKKARKDGNIVEAARIQQLIDEFDLRPEVTFAMRS